MVNDDTIKLLRECNAGILMGVSSIDEVLPKVESKNLEVILNDYKNKHSQLGNETKRIIDDLGDKPKEPNPMAKGMSWLKTNIMLDWDKSDATIADLITDGCNMGIKSIKRYINQYGGANRESVDIANKLIDIEQELVAKVGVYL